MNLLLDKPGGFQGGRVEVCLAAHPYHRTVLAQLTHTAPHRSITEMYPEGSRTVSLTIRST